MRVLPLLLLAAAVASIAPADAAPGCRGAAIAQLRLGSPEGYATYLRAGRKGAFDAWLDCDDAQYGLPTAVHETTHLETADTDAFALVGGGAVARPHGMSSFFPPARIAARFEPDDFTRTYLQPKRASSSTDALYLLDEFNAYTHDLAAAVDLAALGRPDETVDHRDGLAAMMAFVAAYADVARSDAPDTWDGLRTPAVASAVGELWARAEGVMAASCGTPRFGTRDTIYLRTLCDAERSAALGIILGRAPLCPMRCLEAAPAEPSGEEGATVTISDAAADDDVASAPHHPFADAAGPRRHGVGE